MEKSVYSLVLSDEVIEAVDRLAYSKGTSRSNLINQILAEYVSYVTPEKRMRDVFTAIESFMNEDYFQIQAQPSDSMLSIRSALKYKYKPTIRYAVELYRNAESTVGELRVSFRTSSQQLIDNITDFFRFFIRLENKYVGKFLPAGDYYTMSEGRFTRKFYSLDSSLTNEELGEAIAKYIRMLDSLVKIYFANISDPTAAAQDIERKYVQELKSGLPII